MSNFKTATCLKIRFPTKQGTVRILKKRENKPLDELIKMRDELAKKKQS